VLLDKTLSALALQDFASDCWATLVIDNNSSDATEETVRLHQQRGLIPNLRCCREPQLGLAHARHRAVMETTSDLIAFVDDDCLPAPDWLRQAVEFSLVHPQAGAIGGRVQLLWESPPPAIALSRGSRYAEQNHGDLPLQMPSTGFTYLVGAGLVLRRTALEESGWLEKRMLVGREGTRLGAGEDVEIVLRIRRAGYDLWYNPAMVLTHIIPERRTSASYLYRMHRVRAQPILSALAEGRVPGMRERIQELVHLLLSLAKLCLRTLILDVLVRRHISFTEWCIRLNLAWGHVVGAFRFLFVRVEL
jgi:GT2 family glycosyltransferase